MLNFRLSVLIAFCLSGMHLNNAWAQPGADEILTQLDKNYYTRNRPDYRNSEREYAGNSWMWHLALENFCAIQTLCLLGVQVDTKKFETLNL